MDILMISLVPLAAFTIVLVALAAFWRWDTPRHKATVVAIAVGAFATVACGWLLYRFGWDSVSLLMIGACIVIIAATYFAVWGVASMYLRIAGSNAPPTWQNLKTGAPILVPTLIVIVLATVVVLWLRR